MMTIASGGGDYDDYCLRWSTTKQPTRALLRHPSKSDHFPAKPKVTRIKIIIHHCQIHDICIHKCPWSTSPPFPRHQFSGSPPPWRTLLTHGQPLVQVVHRDVDVLRMNLILVMVMTLIIVIVTIVMVLIMI